MALRLLKQEEDEQQAGVAWVHDICNLCISKSIIIHLQKLF
jgi:hypothetical protein